MGFTTQFFFFVFFPICMLCYLAIQLLEKNKYLKNIIKVVRLSDVILIIFSMGFYMWACFDDIYRFVLYILFVYAAGKAVEKRRSKKFLLVIEDETCTGEEKCRKDLRKVSWALPVLVLTVSCLVFCLVYFKYTYLLTDIWNFLFHRSMEAQSYMAPLGISFITFSAISYIVDIYRGDEKAGDLIDCALYLSFFPKVVSGPVVLWKDFKTQISKRNYTLDLGVNSLNRIMLGFAKKLILADQFGALLTEIPLYEGGIDPLTALGMMFVYMLQIYFDFSGYSDIAIGLAGLFGLEFKENFNFPYRSKSISEFWRRWHISLGTWFREYVYIPLGGSRCSKRKIIRNQAIIFLLTGIWHGAGWSYLLWGGINGFFVVVERIVKDKKIYQRTPNIVKWFCTMLITLIAWQFFRFTTMAEVRICFSSLFSQYDLADLPYTWKYYFDTRMIFLMAVGTVGATVFGMEKLKLCIKRVVNSKIGFIVQEAVIFSLFVIAIMCMVNSTYSPFIYFQY